MNLEREFSPQVVQRILPKSDAAGYHRTPLHIDFPERQLENDFAPVSDIEAACASSNPEVFNAIGSRFESGAPAHYPVIDINGGAELQTVKGSKVIINTWSTFDSRYPWKDYSPQSLLRDVLGDSGIDVEVFHLPHRKITRWTVESLVLRSNEEDIFDVADSTQEYHSHLYIQQAFGETDHQTLISELGSLGILSPRWQMITKKEGMSIVRTPWTEK
jgi:hypothetical protein